MPELLNSFKELNHQGLWRRRLLWPCIIYARPPISLSEAELHQESKIPCPETPVPYGILAIEHKDKAKPAGYFGSIAFNNGGSLS
jgi:hypothetical protein